MRYGNVTGDIYDRCVCKKLEGRRKGVESGAGYGEDCAVFSLEHAPLCVAAAQAQSVYEGADCGEYGVYAAVNQAVAFGTSPVAGVLLHILLPAGCGEDAFKRIVTDAQIAASECGTAIADVKASVTPAVNRPVLTASALGNVRRAPGREETPQEGAQIVMTKWAGLEGSAMLAARHRRRLLERYPAFLLDEAAGFRRSLSVVSDAAAAWKTGTNTLCAAAEGGIFRALWTLAWREGIGVEVEWKKIPIRQETVEICNCLDVNPYELAANGSLLCITEHGETLLRELHREKIHAAIIGVVTKGRNRVIVNGEERRFLEPARPDAVYQVLEQGNGM